MIASIDQQKEILKIDRWAAFSPNGDILRSDIDKSLLYRFLKDETIPIHEPDHHPEKICSDYDESCYGFSDFNSLMICWLGKPQELPVADGFCPIFNLHRYQVSCNTKDLEK